MTIRNIPLITYAIPYFDKSGPMRGPYLILKGFTDSGWDAEITTIATSDNDDIRLVWDKIPVHRVEGSSKKTKLIKLSAKLLKRREGHIVMSWVWYWHCFAMMISKVLFNSPYALVLDTYTHFSEWDMKSPLSKIRLEVRYGLILRNADIILAEAPLSYEHITRHLKNSRVLQVPVCLWKRDLESIEHDWKKRGYHPKRELTILYTGRFVPSKRIHDLIAAFNSIAEEFPDWRLEIRGSAIDVEYYSYLRQLVDSSPASSRISRLPSLSGQDLYRKYREVAIFCLPSEFEGIPTAILEAMYFGGAIVSANAGSISYQLNKGYCGLLFEPGDLRGLTNHLKTLMESEHLRETYMRRAKERLLDQFTWEKYFEEVEQIFREIAYQNKSR